MSHEHVHPIFRTILEGIAPSRIATTEAGVRWSTADFTDEELAELDALDSLGDSL